MDEKNEVYDEKNEVYVITGITDPFEDKREVLAVVDSKEQAELAECYYNSICNDVEIEHSKIVHFRVFSLS